VVEGDWAGSGVSEKGIEANNEEDLSREGGGSMGGFGSEEGLGVAVLSDVWG
jgi:hypothetical protein